MLGRTLDDSYAEAVRRDITTVTAARLCANALYRYVGPFLAVVARGLDVSIAELGVALTVAQLVGFAAPVAGRIVDRLSRRGAIVLGLTGCAAGGFIAASSVNVVWFTAGLLLISASMLVLVVGAGAWIADHVPFDRRGRVVGLNETSWALGLLIGVSTMGLVTAATSWRWGYVSGGVAAIVAAIVVWRRIDGAGRHRASASAATPIPAPGSLQAGGWLAVFGVLALVAAAEALFVTFGPWLTDEFDVGEAVLAATTFALGAVELSASGLSSARTDRWGKERSVLVGAIVMVVAAVAFTFVDAWAVPGMVVIAVFIGCFEFSIVSAIPIAGDLVAGSSARGLALLMAASTLGRAVSTIPTTWLYDRHGIAASAVLAAAWALVAAAAMATRLRLIRRWNAGPIATV